MSTGDGHGPTASPPPAMPLSPDQIALLPHGDLGPALVGVIWALTALASAFLGLRIYCKLSRKRRIWWDDAILIASFVSRLALFPLRLDK